MMTQTFGVVLGLSAVLALIVGCPNGVVAPDATDSGTAAVSSKAVQVAASVGGEEGYGGDLMTGYAEHMPLQIGFTSETDLASPTGGMIVSLDNQSDEDGTFHLSYFASHLGLDDQMMDIDVPAGQEVTVEIPCSEIVGLGPLDEPGEPGCHFADGEAIANIMAVPGFLGQDFICSGVYECILSQDIDDLDGDGDTEEFVIVSDALEFHMTNGGPTGHAHGTSSGMMGSHMGM